ncbi:FadD32-like long-chain-fatty-acid--AMP ligase [Corynebacterium epidermidicanis]|uniref:Acyl-CoA synthetase (AMP-forming)/AMP-acid ligase II n=1 Tax=Corynebacterium epidermidicanis TaxID=1050174 RepID=A0A0G3GZC4_9CORY|nr:FadD32-like long-chain-fatty-acid--AMP ligase [Corynebacterium epidermidicanis]AKK04152.1 acyl-CoA synthetase (AMP-forming)/AMP-acid ligase II [Corynebacterium epidermidicanis]
MDINAAMGRFFNEQGNIVLPPQLTLPAMCEMIYQADLAQGGGDRECLIFWDYSDNKAGNRMVYTRTQMNTRIKVVAARLQQVGQLGDRVAILAGNSPEYIFSFLGAMYAGMVPVPLYDPNEPGHSDHLNAVLADARPQIVCTNKTSAGAVRKLFGALPAAERPRVLAVDALPDSTAEAWTSPMAHPEYMQRLARTGQQPVDTMAFLQYTSGSTRMPAGVMLSHRNIVTNVLQIFSAAKLKMPMRLSLWIPLHHDMGMILAAFVTILGVEFDLMNPRDFIQQPSRWIKQMSRRDADTNVYTVVPNFALELGARFGVPAAGEELDLSAVDGMIVGSEPVTMHALESFYRVFKDYGLDRQALRPSYGMAEATLLVSTPQTDNRPLIKHFDREALAQGRAEFQDEPGENTTPFTGCGESNNSMHMIIVDPETKQEVADGVIGEFWVYGENNAVGYLGREDETQETFRNQLAGRLAENSRAEGVPEKALWMATGDLGTYIENQVFLTSRLKDLIVIAGRNHYPVDIEFTAQQATDHLRPAAIAAFAIQGDDVERLVIIAERDVDKSTDGDAAAIEAIREAVTSAHGIRPHDIKIVAPEAINRSSSGKIARRVIAKSYLAEQES